MDSEEFEFCCDGCLTGDITPVLGEVGMGK